MILTPLACLVFLLPVAIYCLILARLNRGRHPVMVPGPWDCAGVLFAVSGFVLFGGPCFLTGLNYGMRDLWLQLRFRFLTGQSDQWWFVWLVLWALYFAVVLGGSALLLWRRRPVTSIYNVEPTVLNDALERVLTCLGLEWTRARNRIFIGFHRVVIDVAVAPREPVGASRAVAVAAEPLPVPKAERAEDPRSEGGHLPLDWRNQRAVLEVDAFEGMRHVTLRWRGDAGFVRSEVEGELARVLREVRIQDNPAGVWFLAIGIFLLAVDFFGVGVFLALSAAQIYRTFW